MIDKNSDILVRLAQAEWFEISCKGEIDGCLYKHASQEIKDLRENLVLYDSLLEAVEYLLPIDGETGKCEKCMDQLDHKEVYCEDCYIQHIIDLLAEAKAKVEKVKEE